MEKLNIVYVLVSAIGLGYIVSYVPKISKKLNKIFFKNKFLSVEMLIGLTIIFFLLTICFFVLIII